MYDAAWKIPNFIWCINQRTVLLFHKNGILKAHNLIEKGLMWSITASLTLLMYRFVTDLMNFAVRYTQMLDLVVVIL
jgi:hypothetical protein